MINDEKAVVVDYKFGSEEHHKYVEQVKRYSSLLHELGYRKVEGFVWYVMLDKIVKVD